MLLAMALFVMPDSAICIIAAMCFSLFSNDPC
jgi:hypothetical protein